eukprot:885550-Rhodomonas_salina.2
MAYGARVQPRLTEHSLEICRSSPLSPYAHPMRRAVLRQRSALRPRMLLQPSTEAATEAAYGISPVLRQETGPSLRPYYPVPGTDIPYAAIAAQETSTCVYSCSGFTIPGTDIRYSDSLYYALRCLGLTYRTPSVLYTAPRTGIAYGENTVCIERRGRLALHAVCAGRSAASFYGHTTALYGDSAAVYGGGAAVYVCNTARDGSSAVEYGGTVRIKGGIPAISGGNAAVYGGSAAIVRGWSREGLTAALTAGAGVPGG